MNTPIIWSPGVTLEAIEKQVIMKAFSFFNKNKTATASALGIAIRTLDSKFEKYAEEEQAANEYAARERTSRDYQLARSRGLTPAMPTNSVADGRTHVRHDGVSAGAVQNSGIQADARVGVEPALETPSQQPVPVPERKEIQEVLPRPAPPRYNGGRR